MAAYRSARYTARTSQKLGVVVLFACLCAPALAESVPLPTPRPAILQARQPAAPSQGLDARAQAPQSSKTPNPVSNPFAALLGKSTTPGQLSTEQRAIVDRVNTYLSGVTTLTGN